MRGASDRLRKLCIDKHIFRIEIAFSTFVDYPQLRMLLGFCIGNDDMDLVC